LRLTVAAGGAAGPDAPVAPWGLTMCGVIGYVGRPRAVERLLHGRAVTVG